MSANEHSVTTAVAHQYRADADTDTVDDLPPQAPDDGLGHNGIIEARERVLVALSGGPESGPLLRRAARLVARMPGAELLAVHVFSGRRLPAGDEHDTTALRELAEGVGAEYQQVIGDDIAAALLAVAEAEHVTQLVVGAGPRRGWVQWFGAVGWLAQGQHRGAADGHGVWR